MGPFASKAAPLVGVDIGSSAVKVLQLGRTPTGYRVEHYASEPLPQNDLAGADAVHQPVVEIDVLADALRRALQRAGCKAKFAAAAVGASAVITKTLAVPAGLSDEDLAAQIQLDIAQYVPHPIDEVSLDFSVLGALENRLDTLNVLVAAARTETVDQRASILELAGLQAKVIDVTTFAIENACALVVERLALPDDAVVAVFDIGAATTNLVVIADGRAVYSREQAFGGRQLTLEVMRHYALSFEQAEHAKCAGGLPDTYGVEVLRPFKRSVLQTIGRMLQLFFASSEHDRVDYIALAGGGAAVEGMGTEIEREFGTACLTADPLADMPRAAHVQPDLPGRALPSLLIACGLALRGSDR